MNVLNDATDFIEDLIMGDFKENPSNMAIIANALIGLIPGVDQVLDVRDVAGMICRISKKGPANCSIDDWVDLAFAALGCIPEVGSLFKGIFKPLWKSRKLVKNIDHKKLNAIEAMLGLKKGGAIKYIKAINWAQKKIEAISYINQAFIGLDSVLVFLSQSRWWVPDDLENLAKYMRPRVKKFKDPIKKGFDQGFQAMQEFVVQLIGEDGYRVVNAAASIALSSGNKTKHHNEKSKIRVVEKNKKTNSGSTVSKKKSTQKIDKNTHNKKVEVKKDKTHENNTKGKDKNIDSKDHGEGNKKNENNKEADHKKVNKSERQTVEKGTTNRVTATQHIIEKIDKFTNKLKGILGEHLADYHCQQIKGWGSDTAKHDQPNAFNSHKLNDEGIMVQLFETNARGRGIDGIWKTKSHEEYVKKRAELGAMGKENLLKLFSNSKPYSIIEAKCSEYPVKNLGELFNDAKDKNGSDIQIETKRRRKQNWQNNRQRNVANRRGLEKKKKPKSQEKSVNDKGGSLDVGGERSRQNNGKVMQMSHNWILTRLRTARLAGNDPSIKKDLVGNTHKVYCRYALFFSVPQINSHLIAIAQKAEGKVVDHDIHIAHEVTREWGDSAIAKVADQRGGLYGKDRNRQKKK